MTSGYGYPEVVIESPRDDCDLMSVSDTQRDAIVAMYHGRYTQLIANPGIKCVLLFNHRRGSGASLRHPHAQLIALGTNGCSRSPRGLATVTKKRSCA
jgi:UDPglucose--hexose-1-phosphate uridylyltransferase